MNNQQNKNEQIKKTVKKDLKLLADAEYKKFHSNLCPGINNILGVRIPVLRKYAKDFANKYQGVSYKEVDNEFYEEIMLQGMLIGIHYTKTLKNKVALDDSTNEIENMKKDLKFFIPKIDNWAVCDIFVGELKFIKREPEVYWELVKEYSKSNKEFEKRFSYVVMLSYYLTEIYIDEVLKILLSENSQDYYVYMAVAWALSICLIKYYDKTLNAMKKTTLNKKTYNKAIQKACESYRISKMQKEELRLLKKR